VTLDLVNDPVPKLFRAIAVPASVGFFFNTMYNVVDTYCAGLIDVDAIAALSISFPVFFIIIALGSGISQGTTALIANVLGDGERELAKHYTRQAIVFGILLSLIVTPIGYYLAPSLFKLLGAKDAYLQTALQYIQVIFFGAMLFINNFILNGTLSAYGDTKSYRNTLLLGFVLNMILNPLFMFGIEGFIAGLGISGIALATVSIQGVSTFYLGVKARRIGALTFPSVRAFLPRRTAFAAIFQQGYPASLNMLTVALGIFIITYFLGEYGQNAVAGYGIAIRTEQICLLPTIGLNIATLSLVGQNNGAGRTDRVKEIYHCALRYGLYISIIGGVLLYVFGEMSLRLFTESEVVVEIGAGYLLVAAVLIWFYVALFVTVSLLQGLKRPIYALWVGLCRQLVFPTLFFWLGTKVFKLEIWNIWASIAIITITAALIMLGIGQYHLGKLPNRVNDSSGLE
jgi:putative MATE family efflux protein